MDDDFSVMTNILNWIRRLTTVAESQLARRGYLLQWQPAALAQNSISRLECELEFVVAHLQLRIGDIFFVSIGANDGVIDDPLFPFLSRFGWSGVMIEPVPETFEKLERNFTDYPNIELLNVAIADEPGCRDIFSIVSEADSESRASHFASFDRSLTEKNLRSNVKGHSAIVRRNIKCMTLDQIVDHVKPQRINVLQVDAEGFDYHIIKKIDFGKISPELVNYEHAAMSKMQQEECVQRFVDHGYRVRCLHRDTLAYRL